MNLLRELALKHRAEKPQDGMTAYYLDAYWEHLKYRRSSTRKVLEIGVAGGGSLRMWKDFFRFATIYGIDNYERCIKQSGERIKVYIGDQGDEVFLRSLGGYAPFDLIIDDGSHHMKDQQISFKVLFPFVRRGGFYVIEDLHTSYWTSFGAGTRVEGTTVEFLKDQIDDSLNPQTERGDVLEPTYPIRAMHWYQSIVFVEKK